MELFLSCSPVSSSCLEMYWVMLSTVVVVTALEEAVGAVEDVLVVVAVVVDVDVKVVVVVEVVVEVVVVVVVEAVVMLTKLFPFTVILLTLSCDGGK